MIPHAAQPKLGSDIDVPLSVLLATMFANLFSGVLILLPNGTAVYAFNRASSSLALGPLIEAGFVDVVSARCLAPQNVLCRLEFHDTHGTITLDRLSLSGVRGVF